MSELQRYCMQYDGFEECVIEEAYDRGEWVKASDAESALAAKDARIKELEVLVERLKNCTNCKHDQQEDHDPDWGCEGCLDGHTKWEARDESTMRP